jgi:hypothetical protein
MKKGPGKEARAVPAAVLGDGPGWRSRAAVPGGGRDDEFLAVGVAE